MKQQRGINLAELMVAIVIFAVCVLLLMGMFSAGSVRMRQARGIATASFLAKEKMEEVLTEPEITNDEGEFTEPFSEYTYTVRVNEYEEDATMERIEVTVVTPESMGAKKVTLLMLRAF